jgi:acyl carrier protein
MNVEVVIEGYVLEKELLGRERTKINPDESLISSGILDSMALLQLVAFIEDQFAVTVADGELVPDNFETINHITAFIQKKKEDR